MADLDLDAGRQRADPLGHPLGLGEVRAVAVEERDELVARLERRDRREDAPSRGRRSTAMSPSSGSSAIVWPRLTFFPPMVASRTASVTTRVWIARAASVIGPAFAAAPSVGSRASRAAKPSAAFRVGTTATGRSVIAATWRAARTTFGLLGRSRISRASTPLDGLEQLAGARVRRLAALDDAGHAEVAEDRGEAVARDDRDDAQRDGARGRAGAAVPDPFRSGSAAVPRPRLGR